MSNLNPIYTIDNHLRLFHLYGVWPYKSSTIFYHIGSVFLHVFISTPYLVTIALSFFTLDTLEQTVQVLYILLTVLGVMAKITNLGLNPNGMKMVANRIRDELNMKTVEEFQIWSSTSNRLNRLNKTYLSASLLAFFAAVTSPIFSSERTLPFHAYVPLMNWKTNNIHYACIYVFQIVAVFIHCTFNVMFDTFPSSLMCMLGIKLDLIGLRLKRLGLDENNRTLIDFKRIILEHINAISYAKQLENTFSVIFFIQFYISGIVLCVTALQISLMSPTQNLVLFLLFVCYIIAMLFQIFIPCYYGNEVTLKSHQLTQQIYHSNWIEQTIKYKKVMIIFQERLKKPIIVTAGRLFKFNLQTFTSILNSSYSLYAVLNRFK